MPRYKITQHLTGWKVVENYIDAKDEDEAWKKHDQDDYVGEEWREAEEEYKVTDTEITKEEDTPTEEVKIAELEESMKDVNKIISNFKKGVADALFRGKENNPNNLDYYRQGYDYGIFLYSEINEEEREAASSKPQAP